MSSRKSKSKKIKLAKAAKTSKAAPFWGILRKFGRRRTHRWRLNPQVRRHWRRNKIKV
jgi:ribosomal protein L39E